MSASDEQSWTVGRRKVSNKSRLVGIQEGKSFSLVLCGKRVHAWLTLIPSVAPRPLAAQAFCTARSSSADKSNAAVFIMCVCWGRWVLDKVPRGASQRHSHEMIFPCGSVRETGLPLTASPFGSSIVSRAARSALSARCTSR